MGAKVSRKKTDMPGLQIDTTSAPSKRKSILGFVTGSPPARKKSMVPSAAKRRSTVRFGTSTSSPPAKKKSMVQFDVSTPEDTNAASKSLRARSASPRGVRKGAILEALVRSSSPSSADEESKEA